MVSNPGYFSKPAAEGILNSHFWEKGLYFTINSLGTNKPIYHPLFALFLFLFVVKKRSAQCTKTTKNVSFKILRHLNVHAKNWLTICRGILTILARKLIVSILGMKIVLLLIFKHCEVVVMHLKMGQRHCRKK